MQRVKVPSTSLAANNLPKVRTPETVKAYPLGRYTDPNFPEEMHERHTLYRREQSAEWNYRPSKPYALPLGPVIAQSNPSPSNYARTDSEQINRIRVPAGAMFYLYITQTVDLGKATVGLSASLAPSSSPKQP